MPCRGHASQTRLPALLSTAMGGCPRSVSPRPGAPRASGGSAARRNPGHRRQAGNPQSGGARGVEAGDLFRCRQAIIGRTRSGTSRVPVGRHPPRPRQESPVHSSRTSIASATAPTSPTRSRGWMDPGWTRPAADHHDLRLWRKTIRIRRGLQLTTPGGSRRTRRLATSPSTRSSRAREHWTHRASAG